MRDARRSKANLGKPQDPESVLPILAMVIQYFAVRVPQKCLEEEKCEL